MKPTLLLLLLTYFVNLTYGQSATPFDTQQVLQKNFSETSNVAVKEQIYLKLQTIAPEGSPNAKGINYDELRRNLTMNYLQQDSIVKYEYYVNAIKDKVMSRSALQDDKITYR